MNGKRFSLGKAPFLRKADLTRENTSGFMLDFMIALAPLIIFGWVKNGLLPFIDNNTNFWGMIYPLILPLAGGAFSFILEFLWYKFIVTNKPINDRLRTTYAPIPGLLLGMIVSVSTPLWVLLIGTIFATVIAKLLFGGFGHNIFNPALVGFLFLTTYSYSGLMSGTTPFGSAGYLNPTEAATIVSGATPMGVFNSDPFTGVSQLIEEYGLLNMFLGFTPGAVAETSALLCLVALIYLLVRKVINWRIPVIYIGTVFVLTYIIGAFNGYAGTLDYALFGIFNGALMFGAVFMATEPVTSPRNPNGKVIYALGLGVITVVFRFASRIPEGVAISILTMNMLTAIIERFATKLRVEPNKRKVVLQYSLVGLLLLGIASFPVVSSIPEKVEAPAYEFEYLSNEQDYTTFNFLYHINDGEAEFVVTTDQSHNILEISNSDYDNDDAKSLIEEIISSNKINNFVISASETVDSLVVVVNTRGFGGNITSTISYDNDFIITDFSVEYNETYHMGEWQEANGHPRDVLPAEIIANQDDLDSVNVIAGATVTSNAIIRAVGVANGYVDYLESIEELTLVSKTQDFETLDFVYIFRNADGKFVVNVNLDGEITSTIDETIKTDVEAVVEANKFTDYIESATEDTLVIKTKAYGNNPAITSTIKFDGEFKIVEYTVVYNESYDSEYNNWDAADGHPKDVIPSQVIENQDDLDEVELVSGATVTSRSILRAAQIALDYLKHLEALNE
ncbi:MAG TPA: FMN-binding protein [Acholeplasmataceae bacterium]|nr:FMN-binding protein [Acholeplasmataceae bacterium]